MVDVARMPSALTGHAAPSSLERSDSRSQVLRAAAERGQGREVLHPDGSPPAIRAIEAGGETQDRVDISDEARDRADRGGDEAPDESLSDEERDEVVQLQARDQEVRAHEGAHAGAAGSYAGSPSYTYQAGPDGNRYAVGGEVSIDVSPVAGDPQATVEKMRVVMRAANAPAEPSAQDQHVAASAAQAMMRAEGELVERRAAEATGDGQGDGAEEGAEDEARGRSEGEGADASRARGFRRAGSPQAVERPEVRHYRRHQAVATAGEAPPPTGFDGYA